MESDDNEHGIQSGRVMAGLIIIVVGVVMMMDRVDVAGIHLSGHYWPLILIAFGIVRMFDPPHRDGRPRSRRAGAWLVYLGFWALVNELHLFGLDYDTSWPLVVTGAGVWIVWKALADPGGRRCGRVREN